MHMSCFGSCFDPELKQLEQCMFETHTLKAFLIDDKAMF